MTVQTWQVSHPEHNSGREVLPKLHTDSPTSLHGSPLSTASFGNRSVPGNTIAHDGSPSNDLILEPPPVIAGVLMKRSPNIWRQLQCSGAAYQKRLVKIENGRMSWHISEDMAAMGEPIGHRGDIDLSSPCEVQDGDGQTFQLRPLGDRWHRGNFNGADTGRFFDFMCPGGESGGHSKAQWLQAFQAHIAYAAKQRPPPVRQEFSWMWADAGTNMFGVGHTLARYNPFRWSEYKELDETKAELELLTEKSPKNLQRPVELKFGASNRVRRFPCVSEAVKFLSERRDHEEESVSRTSSLSGTPMTNMSRSVDGHKKTQLPARLSFGSLSHGQTEGQRTPSTGIDSARSVILRQKEGWPEVRFFLSPIPGSDKIGEAPSGAEATCVGAEGDFVRIEYKQLEGWVGRKNVRFLSDMGPPTTTTEAPTPAAATWRGSKSSPPSKESPMASTTVSPSERVGSNTPPSEQLGTPTPTTRRGSDVTRGSGSTQQQPSTPASARLSLDSPNCLSGGLQRAGSGSPSAMPQHPTPPSPLLQPIDDRQREDVLQYLSQSGAIPDTPKEEPPDAGISAACTECERRQLLASPLEVVVTPTSAEKESDAATKQEDSGATIEQAQRMEEARLLVANIFSPQPGPQARNRLRSADAPKVKNTLGVPNAQQRATSATNTPSRKKTASWPCVQQPMLEPYETAGDHQIGAASASGTPPYHPTILQPMNGRFRNFPEPDTLRQKGSRMQVLR